MKKLTDYKEKISFSINQNPNDNILPVTISFHDGEKIRYPNLMLFLKDLENYYLNRLKLNQNDVIKYHAICFNAYQGFNNYEKQFGLDYHKGKDYFFNQMKLMESHPDYNPNKKIPSKLDFESDEYRVGKAISHIEYMLGADPENNQIIKREDYEIILNGIRNLVTNNKVDSPNEKIQILSPLISRNSLRYTFYLMHKDLFVGKKINGNFILFIKAYFEIFENWEFDTLKKKFSVKCTSFPHKK